MRQRILVPMLLIACLIGCGEKQAVGSVNPPPTDAASAPDSTDPYFDAALKRPGCLGRPSANDLPGVELAGIKLGMLRDDAIAAVYCDGKQKYNVISGASFMQLNLHGETLGPQIVEIHDGVRTPCAGSSTDLATALGRSDRCRLGEYRYSDIKDSVAFATPGLVGQERVMAIWRGEKFQNKPVIEDVVDSLLKKFGEPSSRVTNAQGKIVEMRWQSDTTGKAVKQADPLFNECARNLSPQAGRSQGWSEGCGLTIVAEITPDGENPALAFSYSVGLMNQDALFKLNDSAQQQLDARFQAAQQKEVDQAKAKAPGAKLD